jgi:hypothetical protein
MIQIKAIFRKARTKQALRLLYGPLRVVQLVEDDAQGALDAALEHFAELARVLDDATAKAIKLDDTGMVEGLTRAKVAATRGTGLLPSFAMPWFPATTTTSRHQPPSGQVAQQTIVRRLMSSVPRLIGLGRSPLRSLTSPA